MPQFGRPITDITRGNFSDQAGGITNIFQSIDEASANDADFIRSSQSPISEVYVCALSTVTDPNSSTGHIIRMRINTDLDAQELIDFTQQLRLNYASEASLGTLIASQQRLGVNSSGWVTSTYTLSGAEADAITDYTSLSFRYIVNKP